MSFQFVNRRGSSKRPRGDDNDEEGTRGRSQRTRHESPVHDNNENCGNCDKPGHTARDWMDGACPKRNKPGHIYDNCHDRRPEEDLLYLFWFRQNKGPIKSAMNVGRCLRREIQKNRDPRFTTNQVIPPPYSPEFARRIQRDHRWQGWEYRFPGHPEREAANRKYEPRYHNYKLSDLAQALDQAGWQNADDEVDLTQDGPRPDLQEPQEPQEPNKP
ncbi:hypothetical protein K445DRAFT_193119 [Daldinia sp. EC12]|nr:hypothetical protein K445DRAFT_193119 [Daldinia sp. EC12]